MTTPSHLLSRARLRASRVGTPRRSPEPPRPAPVPAATPVSEAPAPTPPDRPEAPARPPRGHALYSQVMRSHDRMGTRHL